MKQCDDKDSISATSLYQMKSALTKRIDEKISQYSLYSFGEKQLLALNIFFDMAQEYEDSSCHYLLPIELLQYFFQVKIQLYARDADGIFTAQIPGDVPEVALPAPEELDQGPCAVKPWVFFAVRGRPHGENEEKKEMLAIMAVLPEKPFTGHERLFYEKFANRLGYNLHNRMLARKNKEHIAFVRSLVSDIGHNVIVPNLHFKLLMRQMAGKIASIKEISHKKDMLDQVDHVALQNISDSLEAYHAEINKHFLQSSFFLETLLRQSHFDQGRYVLNRTKFPLVTRIVTPQIERFRLRFEERNIRLEERFLEGADTLLVDGDVGLLSQVLANFFSNAVKYTRPSPGKTERIVRCAVGLERDFFGHRKDGVKLAVFTTGPEISEKEARQLFGDNFRASNSEGEYGTGHGLAFVRSIISQHDGVCGYTREEDGNIFYVVLPVSQ